MLTVLRFLLFRTIFPSHNLCLFLEIQLFQMIHLLQLLHQFSNTSIFPNIWLTSCRIYLLWPLHVVVVMVMVMVKVRVMIILMVMVWSL
jgi:hypothetical protein